jgi:HEAT repeat protein
MSALSSLLVQDKIVSVSTIEEALQRQVIFGGQLDTNLLELRAVDEHLLVEYKARVNGMVPASRDEIEGADLQVVRTVPVEVVERHGIVPLRFLKDALRVAVASPVSELRLGEAASVLGVALEPVMTSELRLRVALSKYYGIELPSRFSRLAGLLAASPPRVQSRRVSGPPQASGSPSQRRIEAVAPQGDRRSVVPSMSRERATGAGIFADSSGAGQDGPGDLRDTYPGSTPFSGAAGSQAQPPILPLPAGLDLIERATTREEVFDAALRVLGGMVEYAACFVVKRNAAYGKAAWGRGTSGDELVRRPVLLEKPGALWAVLQTKAHFLGPLPPSRANDGLLEAIGRPRPSTVMVVPVVLRNRVVVMLYADSGSRRAIGYELAALLPLASAMTATFERLIIERKRTSLFPSIPPPEGFETQVLSVPATSRDALLERYKEAPVTPVPRRRDETGAAESESGVVFAEPGRRARESENPPPPPPSRRPASPAPTDHGLYSFAGGVDTFLRGSEPASPAPQDRGGPASPEALGRAGDGVLILLTEVLGDPQDRRWELRDESGSESSGGRPSASGSSPRPAAAASPRPYDARRSDRGGSEAASGSRAADAARSPTPLAERLARIKARGRTPQGEKSRPRVEVSERPPAGGRGGVGRDAAREGPAAKDVDPALPRGLPDPNCLTDAVEPESIEVLADSDFFAAAHPPSAVAAGKPTPAPLRSGGAASERSEPEADEPRQTPLEVAIVEASAEVVVDISSDDGYPDDDFSIDVEPPVIETRAMLPDSASTAGESIIRTTRPSEPRAAGELPSVIVDMGTDIEELVTRAVGEGPEASAAAEELLQAGEVGLPSLIRRFPGELLVDWENLSVPVPAAASHGRLLGLIARFGAAAVPYLVPKLHSADRVKRYYAVLLLGEIGELDVLEVVGLRLLDYDPRVAALAASVASRVIPSRRLPPAVYRSIRTALTDRKVSEVVVHRAAEAAGIVRDRGAVPALIELLRSAKGPKRLAALTSLRMITGQDFGNSARRWAAWWGRARHQKRVEWLIEALDHRQEQVRAVAAVELVKLVPNDFGFSATAPRKERDNARKRYVDWWLAEGRASFSDRD